MSVEDVFANPKRSLANVEFVTTSRKVWRRYPQNIICHLLAAMEAALVAGLYIGLLSFRIGGPHSDHRFLLTGGFAIGAIELCSSLASGSASVERFLSRMALLPCAATTAVSALVFTLIDGAGWPFGLFCATTVFAGVYLAKAISILVQTWLRERGFLNRLVAVAANDPAHQKALMELLRKRDDVEIVFVGSPSALSVLSKLTQSGQLDEVVLAGREAREEDIAALMDLAVTLVRVTPQDRVLYRNEDIPWARKQLFGSWEAPAAVIARPPLEGWNAAIKRTMDIFGSLIALLVFTPVMLIVAAAIRLESPGPALFVQERVGYRNTTFRMFKFRSMRTDMTDETGSQLTSRDDPRVTKVGAFIRRSSIDELPQLLNVLLGDMSLVGPRPHPKGARAGAMLYDELIPNFYSRYRMKPGITGLAQVSGLRGNTETEQHLIDRFSVDLQYAAEWTPLLDIAIILRTTVHVILGTNAY